MPATAIDVDSDINHAKAWALAATGIIFLRARANSGLFSSIAAEIITKSAAPRFSCLCPTSTFAPSAFKEVSIAESFLSEPETVKPLANIILAIPLMPEPPIPIKWIFSFANSDSE